MARQPRPQEHEIGRSLRRIVTVGLFINLHGFILYKHHVMIGVGDDRIFDVWPLIAQRLEPLDRLCDWNPGSDPP